MSKLVIFLHIPRTGGSSFVNLLQNNFDKDRICRFPRGSEPANGWENIDCIHGHFYYDDSRIHECFPNRELLYISFLRDPLDRVISYYYNWRKAGKDHMLGYHDPKRSESEWIKTFIDNHNENNFYWIQNCMTRFIGGSERVPEVKHLNIAFNRLENICFGLTFAFNYSIARFKARFPDIFKTIEYKKKNINELRPLIYPEELRTTLSNYNGLDKLLYKRAYDLFFGEKK